MYLIFNYNLSSCPRLLLGPLSNHISFFRGLTRCFAGSISQSVGDPRLGQLDLLFEILDVLLTLGPKVGAQGHLPFIFADAGYEFPKLLGLMLEIIKSPLVLLRRANTLAQEALR